MKTNRSGLLMIVTIAMIAVSSCSVEYRARHPRPRPKRVIVVGKTDTNEKINTDKQESNTNEATIAVY
ncbi:hypothetical protein FRZ67_05290 [Panacibacter ginsenosidivorans]|uniref:Uncharacterized protein n=1 Tax=Panacibacter ginsenosidivorans TaxID=1813871 RepID=A0A5B8V6K4_9BACT|nr:hypothetical protein [Panacibacter ginsenosidivorans]QEC66745.1 hypothetical protein FRZ67_05290 [Panacibacter ginsenosidivorans]